MLTYLTTGESMEFNNSDQLKAFLKNESKRLGISINNTYNTFFSKILLKRISEMSYDKLFVKGSFSELAHLNDMIRPITDIDLVSTEYHNDPLLILYRAMYDTNGNIFYELSEEIAEHLVDHLATEVMLLQRTLKAGVLR